LVRGHRLFSRQSCSRHGSKPANLKKIKILSIFLRRSSPPAIDPVQRQIECWRENHADPITTQFCADLSFHFSRCLQSLRSTAPGLQGYNELNADEVCSHLFLTCSREPSIASSAPAHRQRDKMAKAPGNDDADTRSTMNGDLPSNEHAALVSATQKLPRDVVVIARANDSAGLVKNKLLCSRARRAQPSAGDSADPPGRGGIWSKLHRFF
jgi:hypothetical protein